MKFSGHALSCSVSNQKGKRGRKSRKICFEGAALIDDAAPLAEFLRDVVFEAKSLVIDLSAVSSVDVSFFQILVALAKTCSLSEIEVSAAALPDDHVVSRSAINAGFPAPAGGLWFAMPCIPSTGADS